MVCKYVAKSFFIAVIKSWNSLPTAIKTIRSKYQFKNHINTIHKLTANPFDNTLPRKSQIMLAQLRIGFSDLNQHLYNKGCNDRPNCECGHIREDTRHFILFCPLYSEQRQIMLTNINQLQLNVSFTTNNLLYGNKKLTKEQHNSMLHIFSKFLISSKRLLDYLW